MHDRNDIRRRSDGALFRVTAVGELRSTLKMREIETGEKIVSTPHRLGNSGRWAPVGAARSLYDEA